MRFLVIVILCLSGLTTFAQLDHYADNSHWIYLEYDGSDINPMPMAGYMLTIAGDTIVDGQSYRKIYKEQLAGEHNCMTPPCFQFTTPYEVISSQLYSLIRTEDNGQVVYHKPIVIDGRSLCESEEHILFDFSLSQHDTLNDCALQSINLGTEILDYDLDTIYNEWLWGGERKIMEIQGVQSFFGLPPIGSVRLVDGVGFERFGLFVEYQNVLVDFCQGSNFECNIFSSLEEAILPAVSITPNPTSDYLYISIPEKIHHWQVRNLAGQLIDQGKASILNVQDYRSGIYFIQIHLSDETMTKRFVVSK